jgi:hypothetical protein
MRSGQQRVSSFGEWPAGRKPGSYAFERLPSQQAQAWHEEGRLRARRRLAGARRAGAGGRARGRADRSPWDDPLWWRGSFGSCTATGPGSARAGAWPAAGHPALRPRGGRAAARPRQRQAAVRGPRQQRRQLPRRPAAPRWRRCSRPPCWTSRTRALNPRQVVVQPRRSGRGLHQRAAAVSERRSSSQPLSVSRAFWRCAALVALCTKAARPQL